MENYLQHGSVNWRDITVENATQLRDFYQKIAGWSFEEIPMKDKEDDYVDFVMKLEDDTAVAGICHHRGVNNGIPPQWIMYISVENVEEVIKKAVRLGAKKIKEHTAKNGSVLYAILQDPAGALFALAKNE